MWDYWNNKNKDMDELEHTEFIKGNHKLINTHEKGESGKLFFTKNDS